MGLVHFRCPESDQDVTTAIETGHDTLFRMKSMNLKIWVWCPYCVGGHRIKPSDAVLKDDGAEPMQERAAG